MNQFDNVQELLAEEFFAEEFFAEEFLAEELLTEELLAKEFLAEENETMSAQEFMKTMEQVDPESDDEKENKHIAVDRPFVKGGEEQCPDFPSCKNRDCLSLHRWPIKGDPVDSSAHLVAPKVVHRAAASSTQCKYESTPAGCTNIRCLFSHEKVRNSSVVSKAVLCTAAPSQCKYESTPAGCTNDKCTFSHHNARPMKKKCQFFESESGCKNGVNCRFSHAPKI